MSRRRTSSLHNFIQPLRKRFRGGRVHSDRWPEVPEIKGFLGKSKRQAILSYYLPFLKLLQIETLEDFQQYESPELLEVVVRAVKGISDAGVNYLFMPAGVPNRVKPDVHIHHSIVDACGRDVSNERCQALFTEAVELLKPKHEGLTVAALDNTIWRFYSKASI